MIFMVFAIVAAIAVVVYAMAPSFRRSEKSDEERTIELLRKARLMFPSAKNDIVALDALYEHTFRGLLIMQNKGNQEREALKYDSIVIFNAKNKAIIEAVRFEARYIKILPFTQGSLHQESCEE